MRYKVGDLVQDLPDKNYTYLITKIEGKRYYYRIFIKGKFHQKMSFDIGGFEDETKLAKIRNSKLSRKLYPNHTIIDKEWIEPW